MKKPLFLIAFLTCFFASQAQTVGIGTSTPDNKAILDIVSTNKGVLIPRVVDTASVPEPVEGLIIYNIKTKTPYYYDGKQWLSMGTGLPGTLSATTDRITYTVSATGFSTTEETLVALNQGMTIHSLYINGVLQPAKPKFDFTITKESDINSKSFNLAADMGTVLASIEFKIYAAGTSDPYVSYRLKNVVLTNYRPSGAAGGPFIENVSFDLLNYGFKDWVNNVSFDYNLQTTQITPY